MNRNKRQKIVTKIELPIEILWEILGFFYLNELTTFRRVCKQWKIGIDSIIENGKIKTSPLILEYYSNQEFPNGHKLTQVISDRNWYHLIKAIDLVGHPGDELNKNQGFKTFINQEIQCFTNLTKLSINASLSAIYDFQFLTNLSKLEKLDLNVCMVPSLPPISFHSNLKELSLSQNYVSLPYCDLSLITSLTKLNLRWTEEIEFPFTNLPLKNLKTLLIDCHPSIAESMAKSLTTSCPNLKTEIRVQYKT